MSLFVPELVDLGISGTHDGTVSPLSVSQDGYILDAGLNAGLELPFTCRGGICG